MTQLARRISVVAILALLAVVLATAVWTHDRTSSPPPAPSPGESLDRRCHRTADWLRRQLGDSFHLLVRSPFILASDARPEDLQGWYETLILPAATAMSDRYFRTPPHEPITVIRCSGEQEYRRTAEHLFSQSPPSPYGYYRPHLRTILLNDQQRGAAAARHELTHALMDFDFPAAPAWLREGLAALHEDGELAVGDHGIPLDHRRPVLRRALSSGQLPSLAALLALQTLHDEHESLHYAHAQHFCRYLQQQTLLEPLYQRLRAATTDCTGQDTLQQLVPDRTWSEWEAAFRRHLQRDLPP